MLDGIRKPAVKGVAAVVTIETDPLPICLVDR